jgi:hypothetical protein
MGGYGVEARPLLKEFELEDRPEPLPIPEYTNRNGLACRIGGYRRPLPLPGHERTRVPNRLIPVFSSTIALSSDQRGGANIAMTAGFVVSQIEAWIQQTGSTYDVDDPMPPYVASRGAWLRGYLISRVARSVCTTQPALRLAAQFFLR